MLSQATVARRKSGKVAALTVAATLAVCGIAAALWDRSSEATMEAAALQSGDLTYYATAKTRVQRLKTCGKAGLDVASADSAAKIDEMLELSGGDAFAAGYRSFGEMDERSKWRFTSELGSEGAADWDSYPKGFGEEVDTETSPGLCGMVGSNGRLRNVQCTEDPLPFFCEAYSSSPSAFRQVDGLLVSQNNQLDTPLLKFEGRTRFELVSDLNFQSWQAGNVFQIGNEDSQRAFGLWIQVGAESQTLQFRQDSAEGANRGCDVSSDTFDLDREQNRILVQSEPGRFEVFINGESACSAQLTLEPPTQDQKVWLSNPWADAADVRVRGMRFQILD